MLNSYITFIRLFVGWVFGWKGIFLAFVFENIRKLVAGDGNDNGNSNSYETRTHTPTAPSLVYQQCQWWCCRGQTDDSDGVAHHMFMAVEKYRIWYKHFRQFVHARRHRRCNHHRHCHSHSQSHLVGLFIRYPDVGLWLCVMSICLRMHCDSHSPSS